MYHRFVDLNEIKKKLLYLFKKISRKIFHDKKPYQNHYDRRTGWVY